MRILFLSVVAMAFISPAGPLELEIFPSPLEILANEDALLMCKFDKPEYDLTHTAVRWAFGSQTNQRDMYIFDGGDHYAKRNGAKMFDDALRKGNASLYLPNVRLDEAGEYTCIVIVTPQKEQKSSVMLVFVQPKVSIYQQEITTADGAGHFLVCDVKEFYPKQVNISWLMLSDGKMEYISKSQSIEDSVTNSDGTFSVSSKIRIESTLDDRTKYTCVVKHKTFLGSFTLDSDQDEEHIPKRAIIGGICAFAVLCVVCFGVYCWIKKRKGAGKPAKNEDESSRNLLIRGLGKLVKNEDESSRAPLVREPGEPGKSEDKSSRAPLVRGPGKPAKNEDESSRSPLVREPSNREESKDKNSRASLPRDPPTTSDIKNPREISDGKETIVRWNVPVFRPELMNIVTSVRRKGQQEAKKLFHWKVSELSGPKRVTSPLKDVLHSSKKDDSFSADTPEFQCNLDGSFCIPCFITLYPDVSKDDGAELIIEVQWDASEETWMKNTVLKLTAEPSNPEESEDEGSGASLPRDPPTISDIRKPREISDGEETILPWDVSVFRPEVMNIVISVKRKGQQEAKKLFHWKITAELLSGPKRVTSPLKNVLHSSKKEDSFSAHTPEFQRKLDGSFCILCSITLYPDVSKDDGAELIIEIKRDTNEETWTESTVLKVPAGQDKPKEIEDDPGKTAFEETNIGFESEPGKPVKNEDESSRAPLVREPSNQAESEDENNRASRLREPSNPEESENESSRASLLTEPSNRAESEDEHNRSSLLTGKPKENQDDAGSETVPHHERENLS